MSETAIVEIESKTLSLEKWIGSITIKTPEDYVAVVEARKSAKALIKEIEDTIGPIKKKAHDAWMEARRQETRHLEAPERILKIADQKLIAWDAEQERIRIARERELQALANKQAEEAKIDEAAHLEETGQVEEAEAVLAEPIQAPTVVLPKTTPKVEGLTMREHWEAQVFDPKALIAAIAAGTVPMAAITINASFLNNQARQLKGTLNYPGVRAVMTRRPAGTGR